MTPELRAHLARGPDVDHDEVLQLCSSALKASKNDAEVQRIQSVALLKLDRFDEAVKLFDDGGRALQQSAALEYAYALYKSGNLSKARDVAKRVESRGGKHLEAQASYRLEDFAAARQLYADLATAAGEEESDVRINGRATDAQLEWARQGHLVTARKASREDFDAFETVYNVACGCIGRGELGQAGLLLRKAQASDLGDDEKKAELLPIQVQRLYVLSVLGKTEEAEALASEINVADVPDASTKVIANLNKLATSGSPANPFLAHRTFHSAPNVPESDSLFGFQKVLIKQNEMSLDLLSFKFNGIKRSTAHQLGPDPAPTTSAELNSLSAANSAAHAQSQLGKMGLKSILPLLEKRPRDIGLLATIVQLYMLTNNHGAAIKVVETVLRRLEESQEPADHDVRFTPGLVAIVVSLHAVESRRSHIRSELAKATSHWRHRSKPPIDLLRLAGLSLLESDVPDDQLQAGQIFKALQQADPSDRWAAAGVLAAGTEEPQTSDGDPTASALTPIERLTSGIDVSALEAAGVAQVGPSPLAALSRKRAADEAKKPAKKRVRKSQLPKDLDPSKPPDPERWLPLRDRSSYRPKGRKGKQKQAAQTQGAVEKPEAAKDAAKEVPKGPGGGGGGGAGGKSKKKKGKK